MGERWPRDRVKSLCPHSCWPTCCGDEARAALRSPGGRQDDGRSSPCRADGFRLLHNHLSIDLVRHLFDFGVPGFWPTVRDIRLAMVARAAEHGADVISTYVFSPKEEASYLEAIHRAVAESGGTTHRIQLRPSSTF